MPLQPLIGLRDPSLAQALLAGNRSVGAGEQNGLPMVRSHHRLTASTMLLGERLGNLIRSLDDHRSQPR